ncbi:MAG: hypothetical protein RML12_05615 [Xanthomonadales bacterium]|nr:hypothetical protein [Xanthomonadales bacterium]
MDAYLEPIAFRAEEVARVFAAAHAHGLPVRLHADQLSNGGGAALAARFGALSADHLEYTDEAGVEALARAGTVAVLLPGAFQALRETRPPPVAALRAAGVPIALATDLNPGTSPLASLTQAMHLGCLLFGLEPLEALLADHRPRRSRARDSPTAAGCCPAIAPTSRCGPRLEPAELCLLARRRSRARAVFAGGRRIWPPPQPLRAAFFGLRGRRLP